MSAEARIATALDSTIRGIAAPPISLDAIHRKAARPQRAARDTSSLLRFAIAAAALLAIGAIAFPSTSSALMQNIEARYRAALHALGGVAGPPVPKRILSSLQAQSTVATLQAARARVRFTLVPPVGLPRDVVATTIHTAPAGTYAKATRAWTVGPTDVTFSYRRSDGRTFELRAERYDPKAAPVGKYMFEALDPAADGTPRIVRHRRLAWRNGDQAMTAISLGIGVGEIESIRRAMHGVALPQRDARVPASGSTSTVYLAP
jgi:hypothetical protein